MEQSNVAHLETEEIRGMIKSGLANKAMQTFGRRGRRHRVESMYWVWPPKKTAVGQRWLKTPKTLVQDILRVWNKGFY